MLSSSMLKSLNSLTPAPWPLTPNPGLYVHVPFCQSKCPYCDFYSITSPELISTYLSALEREAQFYSAQLKIPPTPLFQRGV